jgi:hypothetical protein
VRKSGAGAGVVLRSSQAWRFLVVAGILGGGVRSATAQERTGGDPAPRAVALEDRIRGCEICRKMTQSVPPAEFSRDSHPFACGACHHPHTQRTPAEWRATCSADGCHPRPWTRTVFHRVDARVFVNCFNCHQPHAWILDGKDCRSCHAAFVDTVGAIPVSAVAGVKTFEHGKHRDVACASCHRSDRKHAELALASAADCSSCHHQARQDTPCSSCHKPQEIAFSRKVQASMALGVWDAPRTRTLSFPHGKHTREGACSSCHTTGGAAGKAECALCHEGHHRVGADCTQCHSPPPAQAHDMSVHEAACTDCHEKGPVRSREEPRSFCLACHATMRDHNPGDACVSCHDPASLSGD